MGCIGRDLASAVASHQKQNQQGKRLHSR
jgi:hypothetical protein